MGKMHDKFGHIYICEAVNNPFWDSKPELFSDIACLRIPYQPCIVLFGNFFSGTPTLNRRELRLHFNVVPTGAGVFKSRHILLHKYVNRIMITYIVPMMPHTAHHSQPLLQIHWMSPFWLVLKVCHVIAFSTTWYTIVYIVFHTSDLSVLPFFSFYTRNFFCLFL